MKAALLLTALFSQVAAAQVWVSVGVSQEGQVFVDVTSYRAQGPYLKAWDRWAKNEPATSTGYPQYTYQSTKTLTYYDCKAFTYATKQLIFYDDKEGDGKIVYSQTFGEPQLSWRDPIPGSIGERLLYRACTRK